MMRKLIQMRLTVAVTVVAVFMLVLSPRRLGAQMDVFVDIKPGSCPNPINARSNGILPVAILGSDSFDVTQIDIASVSLVDLSTGVDASPVRSAYEDVATPFVGDRTSAADCNDLGADGFLDLTLKFKTRDVVDGFSSTDDGTPVVLTLEGVLSGGIPIMGDDVVLVLNRGRVLEPALAAAK